MPNINHQPQTQCPVTPATPATPVPAQVTQQAAQQPVAQEPTPPASSFKEVAKKGTATLSLNLVNTTDQAIADWKNAGKTGKRFDLPSTQGGKSLAVINALVQHVNNAPGFTHEHKQNFQRFFQEIQSKSQKNENPIMRNNILHVLADAIEKRGITHEQIQMITDGKFTADAYLAMVHNAGPFPF